MSELIVFRSGQGSQGAPGDTGPAGTAGVAAPNVTSFTASADYRLSGNDSVFGFAGVITLPTGDPDYAHLAEVQVEAKAPGSTAWLPIARVARADFGASTAAYAGGEFAQHTSGGTVTWSLRCVALNEYGSPTATPATQTAGVDMSAATAVTASEASSSFYMVDDTTRLVSTRLDYSPTLAGNRVPQNVTLLVSDNNGGRWRWVKWEKQTVSNQTFSVYWLKPGTNTTFKVAVAAGAIGGDPTVWLSSLPSGFVASAGFTVAGLALPSAGAITTASVGAAVTVVDPDGHQYVRIPGVTWTDPTDVNASFTRITVQCVDVSGNPAPADQGGVEVPFYGPSDPIGDVVSAGKARSTKPIDFDFNPAGSAYTYLQYRQYVMNRNATATADWSDATKSVLQTSAWSGAAYRRVNFGSLPDGAIPGSRLKQLGSQLAIRNGKLDGLSPFLADGIINGNFEDWDATGPPVGWTIAGSVVRDPTPFGVPAPSGKYSCTFFPHASLFPSATTADPYQCKPAEKYVLKATIRSGGSANADLYVFTAWIDAAGVVSYLVAPFTAVAYDGAFTDVVVPLTVPAGKCYCQVILNTSALLTVGYWSVDNVRVEKQVSTGSGTTPDGNGGVQLNTTDLTNAVLNSGFENGLDGWTLKRGASWAIEGPYSGGSGSTVSGAYRLKVTTDGTASEITETTPHLVIPGQKWFAEANYATTGASNQLYMQLLDTDGVTQIGSLVLLATGSATGSWDTLSAAYTVPAGVSFMRLWLKATVAAGYALFDAISLRRQVGYGDGVIPDGSGGVKLKLAAGNPVSVDGGGNVTIKLQSHLTLDGSGNLGAKLAGNGVTVDGAGNLVVKPGGSITFDGAGGVVVSAGPGLTFNAGGALVPNQGATVGVNGTGQLIVPASSLGLAEFGGVYEPYAIYLGLPTITSSVPKFIINSATTPWSVWRQDSGVWRAVLDSRDIVANSLVALSSISSPAISGGSIVGASLSLTLNGITVTINNGLDTDFGYYAGIVLSWVSGGNTFKYAITNDGFRGLVKNTSTGVIAYSVRVGYGEMTIQNTAGNYAQLSMLTGSGRVNLTGPSPGVFSNGVQVA